jgi:hypothetical protein
VLESFSKSSWTYAHQSVVVRGRRQGHSRHAGACCKTGGGVLEGGEGEGGRERQDACILPHTVVEHGFERGLTVFYLLPGIHHILGFLQM